MLAHMASHEAIIAVDNILHGNKHKVDYDAVPSIVFASPEAASVGHSVESATNANLKIKTATFPLAALGRAIIGDDKEGAVQIIFDEATHVIIGAHVFGTSASEIIAEMTLAIKNKLSIFDIQHTMHAHPSYAELWHEVAFVASKTPIHTM
jgi:dihydrolipoamide dehydrogenase